MPAIPNTEPATIVAGDSVSWTKTLSDNSADDGWVLSYAAQGPSQINFSSDTTTGTVFEIDLTPADTADWLPGVYSLNGYVGNTGTDERITVSRTSLSITADPAVQAPSTHAAYTLYLIELAIEGRIPRGLTEFSIQGQQITKIAIPDLIKMRSIYADWVKNEVAQDRINRGLSNPRNSFARFGRRS